MYYNFINFLDYIFKKNFGYVFVFELFMDFFLSFVCFGERSFEYEFFDVVVFFKFCDFFLEFFFFEVRCDVCYLDVGKFLV